MKLSCKVIEDILPMYYDGICSDESVALVNEHLEECPQCNRILSDLHSGIYTPEKPVDDLKPLVRIQKKWKKSKQAYTRKGICITLATFLLTATVSIGIWYFSYAKYYFHMTKMMERTTEEDRFFTSSDYTVEKDGYRFEVWLPIVLSNSGSVRVMDEDGSILFLYPEAGGSYSFWFFLTDEDDQSWSVHLKSDMTPDFENHPFPARSDKEKEHIQQLLIEKHDDVVAMLDAVDALWGIDLLEHAS